MNDVDAFVSKWDGKKINNGGTQCVALANEYESEVVKGGWIGTTLTQYASDWWNQYNNVANERSNYIQAGSGQKGDLAVWSHYGGGSSLPHIALYLGGGNYFTQTASTNAHQDRLTGVGLLGFLRPRKFENQIVTANAIISVPSGSTSHTGKAIVTDGPLHVRNSPDPNATSEATYTNGMSFNYDSLVNAHGFRYLSYVSFSGTRRYIAEAMLDGNGNPTEYYVSGGV